ncbi:hypothetical protein ACA910_012683 [Epithemia clementina (nom. ined.)]
MVVVSQHKADGETTTTDSRPPQSSSDSTTTPTHLEPSLPVNNSNFPVKEGNYNTYLLTDNFLFITDSCWKHMERLATKKGHAYDQVYLRVFVDAGGCSGFTYQFEYHCLDNNAGEDSDNNIIDDEKEDLVWVGPHGLRVVIDVGSMDLLRGATLDYVVEMIKSSFEIRDNPQSESACGCGSSFAVKNFAANPALD